MHDDRTRDPTRACRWWRRTTDRRPGELDQGVGASDLDHLRATHISRRVYGFGILGSEPGTYRAVYTGFEFVHLLAGRVVITPDGGEPVEMTPGCAFIMEPGFTGTTGTWEIKEPVAKHFTAQIV